MSKKIALLILVLAVAISAVVLAQSVTYTVNSNRQVDATVASFPVGTTAADIRAVIVNNQNTVIGSYEIRVNGDRTITENGAEVVDVADPPNALLVAGADGTALLNCRTATRNVLNLLKTNGNLAAWEK